MNKNRYIISVGWDRHVNVYTDTAENIRQIQHPQPKWPDDMVGITSYPDGVLRLFGD